MKSVRKVDHIGTDGVASMLSDKLNEITEEEFKKWIDYHLMTCSDSSLIGYSQHGLYVCKKI